MHKPPAPRSSSLVESLEDRRLLTAVPQAVLAKYQPVQWHGQLAYAVPGQWMLQMKDVAGTAARQLRTVNDLLAKVNAGAKATRQLGRDGLVLIKTDAATTHDKLQGALKKLAKFAYVEPDLAVWTDATAANDSRFSSQWALNNTGQTGGTADADIDAPEAWDRTTGDGSVVVGVIDSGVDYTHPDLSANVWTNPGEVAGNGIDDDGDGFVDDVRGWDFANNDNDPMDDNGHGTHVAGTIAAVGNNAAGVSGVAWNAKVMALKFIGADGSGFLSAAVSAINYATRLRSQYGVNVRVTNNSWGGGGYSSAVYDAINASGQAGILFCAAAGNGGVDQIGDNNDRTPSYPASYNLANVISVAATDSRDGLAWFSNYGATSVDLAAPGVSILSTMPGNAYGSLSGTSMATPHVSGVVALACGYVPTASAAAVRTAVLNGVDVKSNLTGKVASNGRLNAANTLALLAPDTTRPAAPTGLTATAPSPSQVNLKWADNSTNESGFRVYRSTDGGATYALLATTAANATTYASTGLLSGKTYWFTVSAYNANGESDASNAASATTPAQATIPSAPTNLVARALSRNQAALTWTDTSSNETGFAVERSTDGVKWAQIATVAADTTAYTAGGLKRRTSYSFRVRAYNAAGNSAYSNVATTVTTTAVAAAAPSPPTAGVFSDVAVLGTGDAPADDVLPVLV